MVLCYSMFTPHDYVLFWLVYKFLSETGFAFCFDICQIIDRCSPNCSKNGNGKIYSEMHVVQVCLWLAEQFGKTSIPWVDDRFLSLLWKILALLRDAWYILNCSLLKRLRFLNECSSLTLWFTIIWSFIVVIWCAPQSNKSSPAMRNEIVYTPMREHWSGQRLQWIKQNIIDNLKQYIFLQILIEGDRGRFKVSKRSSPAM